MTISKMTPDSTENENSLSTSNESATLVKADQENSSEFLHSLKDQSMNTTFLSNPTRISPDQEELEKTESQPSSKAHIQVHSQESQVNSGFQFSSDQVLDSSFQNRPFLDLDHSNSFTQGRTELNSNLLQESSAPKNEAFESGSLLSHNSASKNTMNTALKFLGLFGIVVAIGAVVYFTLTLSNQVTKSQIKDSIQVILSDAQTLADQNHPQEALTTIEEGLEKYPNNQDLLKQKNHYEDEVEISKILEKVHLEEQNNPSQALTTLATGLALFPESSALQEAQSTLKKNLKSDALEAAKHYEEAQNFDRAIAILDEAMHLIGEDADLNGRKEQDQQKAQEKSKVPSTNNQIKVAQNQTSSSTSSKASTPVSSPSSEIESPFVLPNSSTQLYSYEQVAQTIHSKTDLELAINEIYARNGRSFDTPKYKSYFEDQSWYTPTYSSSAFDAQRDTLLSSIELQNIETLVAYGQNQGWR